MSLGFAVRLQLRGAAFWPQPRSPPPKVEISPIHSSVLVSRSLTLIGKKCTSSKVSLLGLKFKDDYRFTIVNLYNCRSVQDSTG